MSNPDATPPDNAELLEEQRQWGEKRMIDGSMCRQCRRCLRWFHIGWTAYHGCAANRQFELFDHPTQLSLPPSLPSGD